jgi:hypothetical protein
VPLIMPFSCFVSQSWIASRPPLTDLPSYRGVEWNEKAVKRMNQMRGDIFAYTYPYIGM